jgi:hypothetical protein
MDMKPLRLRLVAAIFIVLGLVALGFMLWISGWERADRGGPAFLVPGSHDGSTVKADILPLLGQIGGGAIGIGIVWLVLAQIAAFRQKRAVESGVQPQAARRASPLRTAVTLALAVVIALVGTVGWRWYSYVTTAESPYDEVGIALTSWMPEPVRKWGCSRLHERFTGALPPLGCGDATGKQWI